MALSKYETKNQAAKSSGFRICNAFENRTGKEESVLSNLYERDYTFASDEMLYEAVKAYGTPLLVYSEETLRSRVEKVKAAFSCFGRFQ